MIVIRSLKIKKLERKLERIHYSAMYYAEKSISYFNKYNGNNNAHILALAKVYRDLFRKAMNNYLELSAKRDSLKTKPIIFWE